MKKLLFSLTKKDFEFDTFRAGGKGGQNQNKVESGVRCTHEESRSVGIARDSRDQSRNRKAAFLRCVESDKFKKWHKIESARRMGEPRPLSLEEINKIVDDAMKSENLKIETYEP